MKKKLREQVKALAQKIIEEESTFKTGTIKSLVGELYEKITVLEFLENQIEEAPEKSTEESLDSKSFREENWFTEPEPLPQPENTEDLIEPLMEKIKDIVAQMPEESERVDKMLEEVMPKTKFIKNELEEFASNYQQTPTFERKNTESFPKSVEFKEASKVLTESRSKSLNDSVNKGLNIGLNDRLAFIKHLFDGQIEDYARVLSQINTMRNFDEAESFIKGKIKPDYNYWLNKDEYSERFMGIIEKSFK